MLPTRAQVSSAPSVRGRPTPYGHPDATSWGLSSLSPFPVQPMTEDAGCYTPKTNYPFLHLKRKESSLSLCLLNTQKIKALQPSADVSANQGTLCHRAQHGTCAKTGMAFPFLHMRKHGCTGMCVCGHMYMWREKLFTCSSCAPQTPVTPDRTPFVRGHHAVQVLLHGKKKLKE